MDDNFYANENELFDSDYYVENIADREIDTDDFFIDSQEEENARYAEIIRELTEFEELYSENTTDK